MTPSDAIRAIREAVGDTPAAFARRVSVNRSAVLRWETGERVPDGAAVARLCAVAPDGGGALLAALLSSSARGGTP